MHSSLATSLKHLILVVAICCTLSMSEAPPRDDPLPKRQVIGPDGCSPGNYDQPCIKTPSVNGTGGVNRTCEPEPDGIEIPYCKGIYNYDGCCAENLGQSCTNSDGQNSTCIIAPDPWFTAYICGIAGEPEESLDLEEVAGIIP